METLKITKPNLRNLTPHSSKRVEFKDVEYPYLRVRLTPSNSLTISVYKKPRGQRTPQRVTLFKGTDVPDRNTLLREARAAVAKLDCNAIAKPRSVSMTFEEACEEALATSKLAEGTETLYRRVMGYFHSHRHDQLANVVADATTIAKHFRRIEKAHGTSSAQISLRVLRRIVNVVRVDDAAAMVVPAWPTQKLRVLGISLQNDRRNTAINDASLPAWTASVMQMPSVMRGSKSEGYRDYFLLLILNGLRSGELQKMTVDDVNLKTMEFTVNGKTGLRTLPITPVTLPIFERRLNAPGPDGRLCAFFDPKRAIAHVRQTSQVTFTPHDLRRRWARAADSTAQVGHVVSKIILGHSLQGDVTALNYTGSGMTTDDLREPMAAVQGTLLDAMGLQKDRAAVKLEAVS